jgi:hypothetical protein
MKTSQLPLAFAITALISSGALATGNHEHQTSFSKDVSIESSEENDRSDSRETDVSLEKEISVSKEVSYEGGISISGNIQVDSLGMSVIDQDQAAQANVTTNWGQENNSSLDDNALMGAAGNIGVNVAAGDNNVQDNAAALAAADAGLVFGSADAEIFKSQDAEFNLTYNQGVINTAGLHGNALMNAAGNIAVNSAAGDNNVQSNSLAVSVAAGSMGEASVSSRQRNDNNLTMNSGIDEFRYDTVQVSMEGGMSGGYSGQGRGGYAGQASGTTSGVSDQRGDVYLDLWEGQNHPAGPVIGHLDVDSVAQGAQDDNGNGGAFVFDESGEYEGTERGRLGFREVGQQALSGSFSGTVVTTQHIVVMNQNNASIDGNALRNATGNIGVNVASGVNNLQGNSLAISALRSPSGE